MARVTVEDCVQKVPNRFELVLLAAQRARNLSRGEELTVDRDNDKNPVIALREIADETIDLDRIEPIAPVGQCRRDDGTGCFDIGRKRARHCRGDRGQRVHELGGIEVAHLARDRTLVRGGVEVRDGANAGATGDQRVPTDELPGVQT